MLDESLQWLRHLRAALTEAVRQLGERDADAVRESELLRRGLAQWIAIADEALARLDEETRALFPTVDWAWLQGLHAELGDGAEPEKAEALVEAVRRFPELAGALAAIPGDALKGSPGEA